MNGRSRTGPQNISNVSYLSIKTDECCRSARIRSVYRNQFTLNNPPDAMDFFMYVEESTTGITGQNLIKIRPVVWPLSWVKNPPSWKFVFRGFA